MCGIAGYYRLTDQARLSIDLRRMTDLLAHRGPDDEGYFTDNYVGLGVRRLSIIDLQTGHQPIKNEASTIHVVFNGEIYNYRELRQELIALGHRFTTQSDTEVLVHGYESWGDDLPNHLRGMFAFAIWDTTEQRLLLARDHFGIKPLYYAVVDGTLLFASEIKSLLAYSNLSREIDLTALDQYLSMQYVPEPRTIFQAIQALPAAHTLICGMGLNVITQPYWSFKPMQSPYATKREAIAAIQTAVADSVRSMLVADVPVGAFLSGGIDSACIVALMTRFSNSQPVRTFSIGFGEQEHRWDELAEARRVATFYGTDHQEFRVEPDIITLLPQVIAGFDQPFANPTALLFYVLSERTRQHVKVALTGTGGDEMFGGYVRYKGMQYFQRYQRLPASMRQIAAHLASYLRDATDGRLATQRLRRFLQSGILPFDEAYLHIISILHGSRKQALYTPDFWQRVGEGDRNFIQESLQRTDQEPLELLMATEMASYLPFNQLAFGDRMTMAQSLEMRVPFVDQRVVEVASNIPLRWKLQGGITKGLFREAMAPYLPITIYQSPKQGFNLPISLWFRHELREWMQAQLQRVGQRGYFRPRAVQQLFEEHDTGKRDHSLLIWALVVLEMWYQAYVQ